MPSFQHLEVSQALTLHTAPITEFMDLVRSVMPVEMMAHFATTYAETPVKYLKLVGDDRVCTRCGALVHSGARNHHSAWHHQLTLALWMLQGWTLAHAHQAGEWQVGEGLTEALEVDVDLNSKVTMKPKHAPRSGAGKEAK